MSGIGAIVKAIAGATEQAASTFGRRLRAALEGRRTRRVPIPIPVEPGRRRR